MAKVYYLAFIFLSLFAASANSTVQSINGTIHVTIGVSAGCSDAARFIQNQVRQTYDLYKKYLEIEFVPWGRTVRDAQGNLNCFFGVNDCWANRVQRCALDLLKGNPDAQIDYMECEYSPPFPAYQQRSLLCAHSVGLKITDVDYCLSTTLGDSLELAAEQTSIQPVAIINFIPFIIFNDNIEPDHHTQGYQRFQSTVCFALADDPTTGVTYCKI